MLTRIASLALKEFIQLVRDRLMAAFILLFPVAQLMLLAGVAGRGVNDRALAIIDQDRTPQSRALAQTLDNLQELQWSYQPGSPEEMAALIQAGQAVVGVVIPAGFGRALEQPTVVPALQIILDGSNTVVANSVKSAAEGAVTDYVQRYRARRAPARAVYPADAAPLSLDISIRYNPDLNSRLFTIPAQMGFIIYQVTLAVASLAFARERELGTLEQLLVTPLRRIELILGKAMLAWLAGAVDFLIMYWVVVRVFGIPMRGQFGLLLVLSLLFVGVEIGFGVIISSLARSQQQAILYVFLLAMLDVALSGYLVPVKNMPALFRILAQASPLQHYLVIIRAIMLKGAGLPALWPEAAALLLIGMGVGTFAVATATRNLE